MTNIKYAFKLSAALFLLGQAGSAFANEQRYVCSFLCHQKTDTTGHYGSLKQHVTLTPVIGTGSTVQEAFDATAVKCPEGSYPAAKTTFFATHTAYDTAAAPSSKKATVADNVCTAL